MEVLDARERDLDVVEPEAFHRELEERAPRPAGFDQREPGIRPDDSERETRKPRAGPEVRDRLCSTQRAGGSKCIKDVAVQEASSIPGSDELPRDRHPIEKVDVGAETVRTGHGVAGRGAPKLAHRQEEPAACFT